MKSSRGLLVILFVAGGLAALWFLRPGEPESHSVVPKGSSRSVSTARSTADARPEVGARRAVIAEVPQGDVSLSESEALQETSQAVRPPAPPPDPWVAQRASQLKTQIAALEQDRQALGTEALLQMFESGDYRVIETGPDEELTLPGRNGWLVSVRAHDLGAGSTRHQIAELELSSHPETLVLTEQIGHLKQELEDLFEPFQ